MLSIRPVMGSALCSHTPRKSIVFDAMSFGFEDTQLHYEEIKLHKLGCGSGEKHAIAVTEKSIAAFHGVPVRRQHVLPPRKRAYQHQQA